MPGAAAAQKRLRRREFRETGSLGKMQRKGQPSRPAAALAAVASGAGDAIIRHPLSAAGTTAFAVIFLFVFANAAWYQPKPHPAPFLVLRPAPAGTAEAGGERSDRAPRDRAGNAADDGDVQDALVRDLQLALQKLEIYSGDADGVNGPVTRGAIRAYQERTGLEVSGRASDALLAHIRVTLSDPSGLDAERLPAEPPKPVPRTEPDLVETIQAALKRAGHEDMAVDGIVGTQTRAAIRHFQSENGLPPDGEPSEALLEKLRQRGFL